MANSFRSTIHLWQGRDEHSEDQHLYWYQAILKNTVQPQFSLIGYPFEEGVKRNLGRTGAANGPDKIREKLTKMAWHHAETSVQDLGNLDGTSKSMEEQQAALSKSISDVLHNNSTPIVLGGGHDLSYGHFSGIRSAFPDKKIGIINLDAHFDLRTPIAEGNSGTPFYQIAHQEQESGHTFHYLPIGIQKVANTALLFNTATELGVQPILLEEMYTDLNEVLQKIEFFIQPLDAVYLTIDLDGFSSSYAPGVSAPSPIGFTPQMVAQIINTIQRSTKLISADIVEYNPEYDIDHRTAHLAAWLVDKIL